MSKITYTEVKKSANVAIYRSLDKAERRELGKWLESPVHNQREDVRDLHHYLLGGDRLYKESALSKTRVWRRLFPDELYDDARMRQTLYFHLKCVEEYLAYQEWRKDDITPYLALGTQLRHRRLDRHLTKNLRRLSKLQESGPYRNEAFFRNEYLLRQEHYTYLATRQRTKELNLQSVADALDQAYLIEKLKVGCRMLFHQTVSKTTYETNMLAEVMKEVEQRDLTHIPALAIYYYILKAIQSTNDDQQYFATLRDTVAEHGKLLPSDDIREVYLMVINLCIPKINARLKAYERESFEWYRQGFAEGILTPNNQITQYTYMNAVFNALRLGEYDWVAEFLEDYKEMLDANFRQQTYLFAKSRLHFSKKEYEETMGILVRIDFNDVLYNLLGKTMLLRIYYEEQEYDALDSLLESFGTYIRRKELTANHKKNFGNIVRLTRRLARLSEFDDKKKRDLTEAVQNAKPLSERAWLLEMLEQK
ncbi:MAG: hypothetical protein AAFY36_18630 [Bacteroidota bacterium]